jgi:hypothetical protein
MAFPHGWNSAVGLKVWAKKILLIRQIYKMHHHHHLRALQQSQQ